MKTLIMISALVGSVAFAQAPAAGGHAAAAPAAAKMTKKEAKAACKAEGKKGKAMKECMKEKTM